MMVPVNKQSTLVIFILLALLVNGLVVSLTAALAGVNGQASEQLAFRQVSLSVDQLFVAANTVVEPARLVDVVTGNTSELFQGQEVEGAAYDPAGDRILFSTEEWELWQWPLSGGEPTFIGEMTNTGNGNGIPMEGLAYKDGMLYGTIYFTQGGNPEGLYLIDPATAQVTMLAAFNSALTDISGLAIDPDTGLIYGTNDDPDLRGLVQIGLDGSLTLVTPYPPGETDVDGLAIGEGKAYLVTDEQEDHIHIYDLSAGAYTIPLPSPWTSSDYFTQVGVAYVPYRPHISLSTTVGTDPNSCAAYSELSVPPGSQVTYCYTVSNTTTTTLSLHDLSDSHLGQLLDDYPFSLPPGASTFVTETTTITTDTLSSALWTAYNPGPIDVYTDTATTSVTIGPPEPLVCNGPAVQFEQGIPGDWQVRDNIGLGEVWSHTNSATLPGDCNEDNYTGGPGLAACASGGQFDNDFDTELWSNPFSIPAENNLARLDYLANYANDANWGDSLELAISADGGSNWTPLLLWQEDHGGWNSLPGEAVGVELSDYAGMEALILRWRYWGQPTIFDDGQYAQLDQIELSCATGSVSIELDKTVGVDPNTCATSDSITVDAGRPVYTCYSLTNTGSLPLTAHSLLDHQLGWLLKEAPYPLAPGERLDTVSLGLVISSTAHTTMTTTASWTALAGNFPATISDTASIAVRYPDIALQPTALSAQLPPESQQSLSLSISNSGAGALDWQLAELSPQAALPHASHTPDPTDRAAAPLGTPSQTLRPPLSLPAVSTGSQPLLGEELGRLAVQDLTGSAGLLGVEVVGENYWLTAGGINDTAQPNYLFQLAADGSLIAQYEQPTSSEWGWVDLAFDGTFLYGSDSAVVEQIDPATGLPTGVTIPCPDDPCRALAYDPLTDHFWSQDWYDPLYEFDRAGNVIQSVNNDLTVIGAAWDPYSPGGPYLWLWSQDGPAENQRVRATQIDPEKGQPTGISFLGTALTLPGVYNVAGGAAIPPRDGLGGQVMLLGLHQAPNDRLLAYDIDLAGELCGVQDVSWLSVAPASGTIPGGGASTLSVSFDSSGLGEGVYRAALCLSSNDPQEPMLTIPVTLTVSSDLIFADGFESGDTSQWTGSLGDGGELSVSQAAALDGSFGLGAVIDDAQPLFVYDDSPAGESRYRARFLFDPNAIAMASGSRLLLLVAGEVTAQELGAVGAGPLPALAIEFGRSGGQYGVRGLVRRDNSSVVATLPQALSDGPHLIEIDWQAASGPGMSDGTFSLYVDDALVATLSGLDTDEQRIEVVALGAIPLGQAGGMSGSLFLDAFESRRQGYIGWP